jgi:hypothetical protein
MNQPTLYAGVNLSRLQALHSDALRVTFYPIVSEEVDACTDLNWAARQVLEARREFDNPDIQLYQLVPCDPAVAQRALAAAQAELDAEVNDA